MTGGGHGGRRAAPRTPAPLGGEANEVRSGGGDIRKFVVVGVGLIGGSCALALKAAGAVREVVGVGRTRANLDEARARGIVDRTLTLDEDWTAELADCDLVLVATPVGEFEGLFAAIAAHAGASTVVTDAGSTKQDVVAAARRAFGATYGRFVPAHPIAGTEHSGAAAAFPTLFRDRTTVVSPDAATDPAALARVRAMWERCGARVIELEAGAHDRTFAAVSHLPHVLAFALVAELAARPDAERLFAHAASGFRDFTRIAASSPAMWRDIALANREALLVAIDDYASMLRRMRAAIDAGDGDELARLFARASDARRRWQAESPSARPAVPLAE